MRQLRHFLFIIPAIILFQCDSPKAESEKPEEKKFSFSYNMSRIDKKDSECASPSCTEVIVNYPTFASHAAPTNDLIVKALNTQMNEYLYKTTGNETTEQLSQLFIKSYQDYRKEFPETQTPWYINLDASVSFTTRGFMSIAISNTSYTGGAHPNSSMTYLNISNDGEVLDKWTNFFNEEYKIKDLIERKFREQHNMTSSESFAEKGFQFENDEFSLSSNFGFNKAGLIVYYNAYEIASYAEGSIVVTVPFSELRGMYKYKI